MHLPVRPRPYPRSLGPYAVAVVALGGVGAAASLAGMASPVRGPLTLVFLMAAPATAISWMVGGDGIARIVVAAAGAIIVNATVAGGMLAFGMWSPRAGILAVALVSGVCAAYRLAIGRRMSMEGTAGDADHGRPSR